jgi:hypothetical protein
MRTFSWNIEYVECLQTSEQYPDFVTLVKWIYTITDEERGEDLSLDFETIFEFNEENITEFIPFSDLTTSKVIEWLEAKHDMAKFQYILNTQLDNILKPNIIQRQLLQ